MVYRGTRYWYNNTLRVHPQKESFDDGMRWRKNAKNSTICSTSTLYSTNFLEVENIKCSPSISLFSFPPSSGLLCHTGKSANYRESDKTNALCAMVAMHMHTVLQGACIHSVSSPFENESQQLRANYLIRSTSYGVINRKDRVDPVGHDYLLFVQPQINIKQKNSSGKKGHK